MNIEQGTRNVEYRSVGVLDLKRHCALNFCIQNSLFVIRYSFKTSILDIPCSIFNIPFFYFNNF